MPLGQTSVADIEDGGSVRNHAGAPPATPIWPRPGAPGQLAKMSSGRNADTSMFGASTTWLIFRSTATLQMA